MVTGAGVHFRRTASSIVDTVGAKSRHHRALHPGPVVLLPRPYPQDLTMKIARMPAATANLAKYAHNFPTKAQNPVRRASSIRL